MYVLVSLFFVFFAEILPMSTTYTSRCPILGNGRQPLLGRFAFGSNEWSDHFPFVYM